VHALHHCPVCAVGFSSLESRSVEVDTELLRLGEQLDLVHRGLQGSRSGALPEASRPSSAEHLDGSEVRQGLPAFLHLSKLLLVMHSAGRVKVLPLSPSGTLAYLTVRDQK